MLPVGAGPGQPYDIYAPLVIYGDTSQDGVWYGGDPHTQSLHNFGPKPMPHIEGAERDALQPGRQDRDDHAQLLRGPSCTGSGSFIRDGFAVAQELALGPIVPAVTKTAIYDICSDHLTLASGTWDRLQQGPAGHDRALPGDVDGHRRRRRASCSSTGRRSSRCRT